MRNLRKCNSALLNTGVSKCPPDFENMKGAILVAPGTKLPANLTADKIEELVHEDRPARIYGIAPFVEYAPNGGEVQTTELGYGGSAPSGVSARTDTFTMDRFYAELVSALVKTYNSKWDVYFFDDNNILYGLSDGTDTLAGYPMRSIYPTQQPFNTSSAKATMGVTFSHQNSKKAMENFDYEQLDFDMQKLVLGLTPVQLVKTTDSGSKYKLIEKIGGNDLTPEYGPLIVTGGETVLSGASAAAYDATDGTLTFTLAESSTSVAIKSPKVLYGKDIKGIEVVA